MAPSYIPYYRPGLFNRTGSARCRRDPARPLLYIVARGCNWCSIFSLFHELYIVTCNLSVSGAIQPYSQY